MNKFFGGASLLAILTAAGTGTGTVRAQTDTSGASSVSEVIVTGTREVGITAADSAAPIQMVGVQTLHRTGSPDLATGCCQSNGNSSPLGRRKPKPDLALAHDCPPLRQGGGASLPVEVSADEVALLPKVIVHGSMDRAELLEGLHPAEALHDPLASSKGQVAVLGPVVLPAADLLSIGHAEILHGRAVGAQAIGDDRCGRPCRFSALLMNSSAAALPRSLVTKDSSTSPSWSTARQR